MGGRAGARPRRRGRSTPCRLAQRRPGAVARLPGLREIEETALTVSVEHPSFEEWREPFTLGVGPAGSYVAGLNPYRRAQLREHVDESCHGGAYAVDEAALRHGAGVEEETNDARVAYARFAASGPAPYQSAWLPD